MKSNVFILIFFLLFIFSAGYLYSEYQIGAFGYRWYAGPQGHWTDGFLRDVLTTKQHPLLGLYDSYDPEVIKQHIEWFEEYGIDFIIFDWWNDREADKKNIDILCPLYDQSTVKYAFGIDTPGIMGNPIDFDQATNRQKLVDVSKCIATNYFSRSNYLKIDGAPVLYYYMTISFQGNYRLAIQEVRTALSNLGYYPVHIMADEVYWTPPDTDRIACFDSIHPYNPGNASDCYDDDAPEAEIGGVRQRCDRYYSGFSWHDGIFPVFYNAAKQSNVGYIQTIYAGYNDRGRGPDTNGKYVPRRVNPDASHTSLFERYFDWVEGVSNMQNSLGIKKLIDPDLKTLIICTWNEWHEDSQIEPSVITYPCNTDTSASGTNWTKGVWYKGYGFDFLEVIKRRKQKFFFPLSDSEILSTGFNLKDGIALWYAGVDAPRNFMLFKYKPFLGSESTKWNPKYNKWLDGLDGKFHIFQTLSDGTYISLANVDVATNVIRTPYYMKVEYSTRSSGASSTKYKKVLEMLIEPNNKIIAFRWIETGSQSKNYRLRIEVNAFDGDSYYPDPSTDSDFNLGAGYYWYDSANNIMRQRYANDIDSSHQPRSALKFFTAPTSYSITNRADINTIRTYSGALGNNASEQADTGKVFYADFSVTGTGNITNYWIYTYGDNQTELNNNISFGQGKGSFDAWKSDLETWWNTYYNNAKTKIQNKMGISLSSLSSDEDTILKYTLIEQKMMQQENDALIGSPDTLRWYRTSNPTNYNSKIRDNTVSIIYLTRMGLYDEYLTNYAGFIKDNYRNETLLNGDFSWVDTYYNWNDETASGSPYSTSDPAFFTIWSFYKSWKETGDTAYIGGNYYTLATNCMSYLRNSQTWDSVKSETIIYYDSSKGLFKEFRLNGDDITSMSSYKWIDSFYINVLCYANYKMLEEMAEQNGYTSDKTKFSNYATSLKTAINNNFWDDENKIYIAGLGYDGSSYEKIYYNWKTISVDYIYALSLPETNHYPFSDYVRQNCLQSVLSADVYASDKKWFATSILASEIQNARDKIVDDIVLDSIVDDKYSLNSTDKLYMLFNHTIGKKWDSCLSPMTISIGPSLYALCKNEYVNNNAVASFQVVHDGKGYVGEPEIITLSALDSLGNVCSYTGVVTLSTLNETGNIKWDLWRDLNGNSGQGKLIDYTNYGNDTAVYTFAPEDNGMVKFVIYDDTAETIDPEARCGSVVDNDVSPQNLVFGWSSNVYFVNDDTSDSTPDGTAGAGDDSRTKEEARNIKTPWRTIQHAIKNISPGDTVLVLPGNYENFNVFNMEGVSNHQYTIAAYSNYSGVKIEISYEDCIKIQNSKYVVVKGFELKSTLRYGVLIQNSENIEILNNKIYECADRGIQIENYCENVLVQGNKIYNNENYGIMLNHYNKDSYIRNNILYKSGKEGMWINDHCTNIVIKNNTVASNTERGIAIRDNCAIYTMENNISCYNGYNGFYADGSYVTNDYNNAYGNASGNYWAVKSGPNNLEVNPRFITFDYTSADFLRLMSTVEGYLRTSSCIDAGDPNDDLSFEPSPNGGRINQGFYGNTTDAEPTPSSWEYHVGTNSAVYPYTNIQDAVDDIPNTMPRPAVVYVHTGTYYDSAFITGKSTTVSNDITISAYSNDKVILWVTNKSRAIEINDQKYVTINGLIFYKCSNIALMLQTAKESRITHNIFYGTPGDTLWVNAYSSNVIIKNNTFVSNQTGLAVKDNSTIATLQNNIAVFNHNIGFYCEGTSQVNSDYNDAYGNPGGNFFGITKGANDMESNPRFITTTNVYNSNFLRLKSTVEGYLRTSACIDAGNPNDDWSLEPSPNGGIINQGFYGNTYKAEPSPDTWEYHVGKDPAVYPYTNIQEAVNDIPTSLTGPATVYIHSGTYNHSVSISGKNTTESNYLVISSFSTDTVIVDGNGTHTIDINGVDYVTVKGLRVTGAGDTGIRLYSGANNCRIISNICYDNTYHGIFIGDSACTNIEIAYNKVTNNPNYGIGYNNGWDGYIHHNYLKGNSSGIWYNNSKNGRIENNKVILNNSKGISYEGRSTRPYIVNNIVFNNGDAGIWVSQASNSGGGLVKNNTVVSNTPRGIHFYNCTSMTTRNNICAWNDWVGIRYENSTGYEDYDNCYGHSITDYEDFTPGGNSLTVNPHFITFDISSSNFLRLKSTVEGYMVSSSCIDAGDPNDDWSLESSPNGSRINQGFYGNTYRAEPTPDTWEYHVGKDPNVYPYTNIQDAVNDVPATMPRPATVYIHSGTYDHNVLISGKNTTESNYLVISSYSTDTVIVNGNGATHTIAIDGVDYVTVKGLRVTGAGDTGIRLYNGAKNCVIESNRMYGNGWHGVFAGDSATTNLIVRNNISYNQNGKGIGFNNVYEGVIRNNICFNNNQEGIWINGTTFCTVINNSVVSNSGDGIYFDGTSANGNCRNNISAYNGGDGIEINSSAAVENYDNAYGNSGSDYNGFTQGANSISTNPYFINYDLNSSNFVRLQSEQEGYPITSPCIDAGDPNDDWSLEPSPNGERINMGAYGGTMRAELTPWFLKVISTYPATNSQNVSLVTTLTMVFSDYLNNTTVPANINLYNSYYSNISKTISISSNIVYITPDVSLKPNEYYTVEALTNITATNGKKLRENYYWHFTTTTGNEILHNYNTITIDGDISDWIATNNVTYRTDLGELIANDNGIEDGGANATTNLWVTWDSNYFYVGIVKNNAGASTSDWYDYIALDVTRDDKGATNFVDGTITSMQFTNKYRYPEFIVKLDHTVTLIGTRYYWDSVATYKWDGSSWVAGPAITASIGSGFNNSKFVEFSISVWDLTNSAMGVSGIPNRIAIKQWVDYSSSVLDYCPDDGSWITIDIDNNGDDIADKATVGPPPAPALSISKSISNTTLAGNKVGLIPGATITYYIVCTNTGTGVANNVILYDGLPTNVTYSTGYVSIGTGWTQEYSTNNIPNQSWTSSDYTNELIWSKDLIKWVRWKKTSMNVGENVKLIYKVIIK